MSDDLEARPDAEHERDSLVAGQPDDESAATDDAIGSDDASAPATTPPRSRPPDPPTISGYLSARRKNPVRFLADLRRHRMYGFDQADAAAALAAIAETDPQLEHTLAFLVEAHVADDGSLAWLATGFANRAVAARCEIEPDWVRPSAGTPSEIMSRVRAARSARSTDEHGALATLVTLLLCAYHSVSLEEAIDLVVDDTAKPAPSQRVQTGSRLAQLVDPRRAVHPQLLGGGRREVDACDVRILAMLRELEDRVTQLVRISDLRRCSSAHRGAGLRRHDSWRGRSSRSALLQDRDDPDRRRSRRPARLEA